MGLQLREVWEQTQVCERLVYPTFAAGASGEER